MNELKPCPFCGSKHVHGEKVKRNIYRVECWCCGASVESVASIDKAIKWWNTRAIDRDELLKIADRIDDNWAQFGDCYISCEEVDDYEQGMADLIRKAVGE